MREAHPVFETVAPESTIWRYFDLPKFVSLLQTKALFFSRANLLGDPLEGSFTRAREVERQALLDNPPEGRTREELERIFRHNVSIYADNPWCAYVNCWHLRDHESMAMWRGYGAGPYGVAIRSTAGQLDETLPAMFDKDVPMGYIFIGRVRYVDYASETERLHEEANAYAPFVSKSLAYQHESELRAVFLDMRYHGRRDSPEGHFVPIDLQRLVSRVTVSPLAPPWYQGVVQQLCSEYRLNVEVGRSIVFSDPIF